MLRAWMPTQAFLSHSVSPTDRPLLDHVESQCATLGIDLYLAEREFAPSSLTEKIREAIGDSDCVIVLLTTSGASSSWVNQEIAIANELAKPIVPLLEEGVDPPGLIRERDQIRFDRSRFAEAFDRATRFIGKLRAPRPEQAEEPKDNTDLLLGIAIGATIVAVIVLLIVAMSKE